MESNKKDELANVEFVVLSREEFAEIKREAAKTGAKAAMEKLEEERKRMHSKVINKRLHNTKLLLRNYRMLKENANHSVYGRSQMDESAADILCSMMNLYDDEVIVDAIKRSATRTAIIVNHVETMLDLYEAYCNKSANQIDRRRYEVIYDMYMADDVMSVKQISKKQSMSKENVYMDLKIATERLSALIFGVDSLLLQ